MLTSAYQQEVIALRADNGRLRLRVRDLERELRDLGTMLSPDFALPAEWSLTVQEARIMRLLLTHDLVTTKMVAALPKLEPGSRRVRVLHRHICFMRRKLTPFGLEIVTDWGRGYRLANRQETHYAPLLPPPERVGVASRAA